MAQPKSVRQNPGLCVERISFKINARKHITTSVLRFIRCVGIICVFRLVWHIYIQTNICSRQQSLSLMASSELKVIFSKTGRKIPLCSLLLSLMNA